MGQPDLSCLALFWHCAVCQLSFSTFTLVSVPDFFGCVYSLWWTTTCSHHCRCQWWWIVMRKLFELLLFVSCKNVFLLFFLIHAAKENICKVYLMWRTCTCLWAFRSVCFVPLTPGRPGHLHIQTTNTLAPPQKAAEIRNNISDNKWRPNKPIEKE